MRKNHLLQSQQVIFDAVSAHQKHQKFNMIDVGGNEFSNKNN